MARPQGVARGCPAFVGIHHGCLPPRELLYVVRDTNRVPRVHVWFDATALRVMSELAPVQRQAPNAAVRKSGAPSAGHRRGGGAHGAREEGSHRREFCKGHITTGAS